MKQLAFSLCAILLYFPLFSQNWQLINPEYDYHYVEYFGDGSTGNPHQALSIWADSTRGDTSWLNTTSELHELAKGEISPDPFRFYQLKLPHFLQSKYVVYEDGLQKLMGPDTLQFYPIGSSLPWPLHPKKGIEVLSDKVFSRHSYQESDSLRQLLLNTGDTLLLSKSFGVIRFPISFGDRSYYQQIGVEGPDVGYTFPNLPEILSFSIGDRFEYHMYNYYLQDVSSSSGTQVEATMIHQVEILDSIHLPQGIAYQTRNFKRIERGNCDWGGLYQTCEEIVQHIEPDAENNYSVWSQTCGSIQWDTLYYSWESNLSYPELAAFYEFTSFRGPQKPSLPHIHMRRGYPREVAYFSQVPTFLPPSDTLTRIHSIASIDYPISSNRPAQGKVSWKNCELDAGPIPDSVQCLGENNSGGISWSIEGEWEKGLGITHIRWEQYPGSYTQTYASKDLVAYRTQLHSFGDFTPESAFCSATVSSSSPLEEGHTIVYPNPAHSTFFIHPDLLASANSLSIFDSEGRNISKGVNIPTAGEGFSVLGYPPGVYFLKIERSQEKSPLWIQLLVAP